VELPDAPACVGVDQLNWHFGWELLQLGDEVANSRMKKRFE